VVALVVALAVPTSVAQVAPGNLFDTDGFADASGGNGGSARGGDGGRGGTGVGPMCNQNTNDLFETDWWEGDSGPTVACGAGGAGGDAGAAGESIGGNGGIAFGVGPPPPPTTTTTTTPRRLLADLFVRQRNGSFIITVGNNGPDPAQAAHLESTLTADTFAFFSSVESTKGTCTGPDASPLLSPSPKMVTCDFGDLAVGELVTVTIHWSRSEVRVTVTNTAVVSAMSPPDPDLTNNSSTLSASTP
jgi:hypothetical protein